MALLKLKRRSTADDAAAGGTAAGGDTDIAVEEAYDVRAATTKGRPTPKRSEARAARPRGGALAPSTSKSRPRDERRSQTNSFRESMRSTDVSKLPPRERTPERVLTRDFVDTRRNVGPIFLLAFAVYVLGHLVPIWAVQISATVLMMVGLAAIIIDSFILSVLATNRVRAQYPDSRVRVRAYAVQRALLPRRWRLPKPRVSRESPTPD